jgi:hypothetical protein
VTSTSAIAATRPDLDAWLPDPAVRTYHCREAATDPSRLWRAGGTVRVGESGLLGRLVRWRVPGTRAEQTYGQMFTSPPFVALEEGEHHLLAGLCGKIWTARPSLAELSGPAAFRAWDEPGTVRVLFAEWVEPNTDGARLVSEVRVAPIDRGAGLRLSTLWPLIGRFEALIGAEPLSLAVRRAESGRFHRT